MTSTPALRAEASADADQVTTPDRHYEENTMPWDSTFAFGGKL
ncbi:hypothetical protein [Nonomuraea sp. SYSU D8015]|nr:hypothetical protein [Nonomuraea sp. SYSU D8015]